MISLPIRPLAARRWALGTACCWALAIGCPPAQALLVPQRQTFAFQVDPAQSGLVGSAEFVARTAGELRGNWDFYANPTGTRTKPGLFGPFGLTENVPVPTEVDATLAGPLDVAAAGDLRLWIDPAQGVAAIDDLQLDLLTAGPISLPATLRFAYQSFRTRSPEATYPSLFPLEFPFGTLELTALQAQQVGPSQPGSLVPIDERTFAVEVAVPVALSGSFDALGNVGAFGPLPAVLLVASELTLDGDRATLASVTPLQLAGDFAPSLELPTIPFELPTFVPPGGTVAVQFDLDLNGLSASLDATLSSVANGVRVPLPGSLALCLWGAAAWGRRRAAG
jgi:hypothetical protein